MTTPDPTINTSIFWKNTFLGKTKLIITDKKEESSKDLQRVYMYTLKKKNPKFQFILNASYDKNTCTISFLFADHNNYFHETTKTINHTISLPKKDYLSTEKMTKIFGKILSFYKIFFPKFKKQIRKQNFLSNICFEKQNIETENNIFFVINPKKNTIDLCFFEKDLTWSGKTLFPPKKISLIQKQNINTSKHFWDFVLNSNILLNEYHCDIIEIQKNIALLRIAKNSILQDFQKKQNYPVYSKSSKFFELLKNNTSSPDPKSYILFETDQEENLKKYVLLLEGFLEKTGSQKITITRNKKNTPITLNSFLQEKTENASPLSKIPIDDNETFNVTLEVQNSFEKNEDEKQTLENQFGLYLQKFSKKYPFVFIPKTNTEENTFLKEQNFFQTNILKKEKLTTIIQKSETQKTQHEKIKLFRNWNNLIKTLYDEKP